MNGPPNLNELTERERFIAVESWENGRAYERAQYEARAASVMGPTPEPPPSLDVGPYDDDPRDEQLLRRLLRADQLDTLPEPQPLVAGVLYLDSVAWLQGRPGAAKSLVALDIAACVATEQPWQGFRTTPVYVLYVIAEGTSGLRQRVRAWESSMGTTIGEYLQFLPMAVQATNASDWDALITVAERIPYNLIVLDTQARLTVGLEENSAKDMGLFVQQLERLRAATGACVLPVHHQGRNGEHMRGSTAMEGAATTVIQVTKDEELVTVRCLKQKDAAPFDDIQLRLVPHGDSAVLALADQIERPERAVERCARWLAGWRETFADEWVSVTTLLDSGVVAKNTFHANRLKLLDAKAIERSGEGRTTRYRMVQP